MEIGRGSAGGRSSERREASPRDERSAKRFIALLLVVLGVAAVVVRAGTLHMSLVQAVLTVLGVIALGAIVVGIAYLFERLIP
jgi:hypothetical protein